MSFLIFCENIHNLFSKFRINPHSCNQSRSVQVGTCKIACERMCIHVLMCLRCMPYKWQAMARITANSQDAIRHESGSTHNSNQKIFSLFIHEMLRLHELQKSNIYTGNSRITLWTTVTYSSHIFKAQRFSKICWKLVNVELIKLTTQKRQD